MVSHRLIAMCLSVCLLMVPKSHSEVFISGHGFVLLSNLETSTKGSCKIVPFFNIKVIIYSNGSLLRPKEEEVPTSN